MIIITIGILNLNILNILHLTLLGLGGLPCHVFAYNRANTRTSVLNKLDFPKYELGKRQYAFYLNASRPKKVNNQTLFWRVSGIQTS